MKDCSENPFCMFLCKKIVAESLAEGTPKIKSKQKTPSGNSYLYEDAPAPGSPNANHVRAYDRTYSYDKLGNIMDVIQSGVTGFTRHYVYNPRKNSLQKIEDSTPAIIEDKCRYF